MTPQEAAFLEGLRDLCNQHRIGVQGDTDDSFATLFDLKPGERIRSITIGRYDALIYEMEPMPMTMLEQMAKAAYESWGPATVLLPWSEVGPSMRKREIDSQVAALNVLRDLDVGDAPRYANGAWSRRDIEAFARDALEQAEVAPPRT
jgi:hypothetical protein